MDVGHADTCERRRPVDWPASFGDRRASGTRWEGRFEPLDWRTEAAFPGSGSAPEQGGIPGAERAAAVEAEPVTLLLVDDDAIDVRAVQRAFRQLGIANPLLVAGNGIEALEMLRGEAGREPVLGLVVILLDLNMPRMDGIEFLRELRADPALRRALVFVMTTSSADKDRLLAYDFNIAGYVLKHRGGQSFVDVIAMLELYWQAIEFPD